MALDFCFVGFIDSNIVVTASWLCCVFLYHSVQADFEKKNKKKKTENRFTVITTCFSRMLTMKIQYTQ